MKKEKENEVEQKKDLNCITKEDIMICSKQFMKPYENLIYKDIKIIIDMENLLDYEKSKMRNIIKLIKKADNNEEEFLLKVYTTTKKSLLKLMTDFEVGDNYSLNVLISDKQLKDREFNKAEIIFEY